MITNKPGGTIHSVGSFITVTCTIELGPVVTESELSLLMVDVQLSRDGTMLILIGPTVTGTIITYTTQLNSFGRSDSGNYTCIATVRPNNQPSYLIGNRTLISKIIMISTGYALIMLLLNLCELWLLLGAYDSQVCSSPRMEQ